MDKDMFLGRFFVFFWYVIVYLAFYAALYFFVGRPIDEAFQSAALFAVLYALADIRARLLK